MRQQIVSEEDRNPNMSYDELTQELNMAQSILDIWKSFSPKFIIRRIPNRHQNISNFGKGQLKILYWTMYYTCTL